MRGSISVLAALCAAAVLAQDSPVRGILPVAGSTPGAFQSNFKTSLQLHNRGGDVARGVLVFHPNGRAAQAGDPSLAYEVAPRQTVAYADMVAAMGITGIGSVDIVPLEGAVPAAIARAFNDGSSGTDGMTVPLIDPRDALRPGTPGVLIAPNDLERFRFNLGIRSLSTGAHVRFVVFGANGVERFSGERTFTPDTLEQRPAAEMLGQALFADDSIAFELLSGAALVYGTTTDNTTNDPSLQTAAIAAAL
jgi:hypothetical protein